MVKTRELIRGINQILRTNTKVHTCGVVIAVKPMVSLDSGKTLNDALLIIKGVKGDAVPAGTDIKDMKSFFVAAIDMFKKNRFSWYIDDFRLAHLLDFYADTPPNLRGYSKKMLEVAGIKPHK